jgi:imidazolonepropionase-like amidohydrolase
MTRFHAKFPFDLVIMLGDNIYGGQGAYDRVDALRTAAVPVLVNLNWPKEEKTRDPDADTPLRTLIHRRLAPTTPAALAAAKVPFAFYSGGLATTSEIFENIRAATDNGLTNEAALAALTSTPATILGVSNRLGTITKGKVANLVLSTDWPWADGAEVRAVFVDGRLYQERKSEGPSDPPASDVSGVWSLTMQTPRGPHDISADITMAKDGKVKGKITGETGETTMDEGRMSASLLRFNTTREFGGHPVTASWSLTVEGEKMSGTMSAGAMQMDVAGTRKSKPEPVAADAAAKEKKATDVSLDELRTALKQYSGPAKKMKTFAITHAQVWTVSGVTIDDGTVVVSDGKIRAVGKDVKIPSGAEVIDARGGALIPGIIDCHSHIANDAINEGGTAVSSMTGMGDVLNPLDIAIQRDLAGGVTTANILHGSANPIGGKTVVIKLRWGLQRPDELLFQGALPGIKFALGENVKRDTGRYPNTRMGVETFDRDAFTAAKEYKAKWDRYLQLPPEKKSVMMPPQRDLELDALVEVLEHHRIIHCHSYRQDEILSLIRIADDFGFTIGTFQHVLEGYKVAEAIAKHGAGGSTFSDWWAYKIEAFDAIPYAARLLRDAGASVCLKSDDNELMRRLNQAGVPAGQYVLIAISDTGGGISSVGVLNGSSNANRIIFSAAVTVKVPFNFVIRLAARGTPLSRMEV